MTVGQFTKLRSWLFLTCIVNFFDIASMTEGYSVKDLEALVLRTLHLSSSKLLRSRHASGRLEKFYGVSGQNYCDALKDYVPSSLRGAKLFKSDVTWADVGGLEKVRRTLRDTLELPSQYARLYDAAPIKLPSGLLLYGPPGCGKTLLAGAVAHECGLNFISVKGPEVLDKYITNNTPQKEILMLHTKHEKRAGGSVSFRLSSSQEATVEFTGTVLEV